MCSLNNMQSTKTQIMLLHSTMNDVYEQCFVGMIVDILLFQFVIFISVHI